MSELFGGLKEELKPKPLKEGELVPFDKIPMNGPRRWQAIKIEEGWELIDGDPSLNDGRALCHGYSVRIVFSSKGVAFDWLARFQQVELIKDENERFRARFSLRGELQAKHPEEWAEQYKREWDRWYDNEPKAEEWCKRGRWWRR